MSQQLLAPIWKIDTHNKYVADNSVAKRQWRREQSAVSNLSGLNKVKLQFMDESQYVNLSESMIELHFNVKKSTTAASTPVALDRTDHVACPDGWLLMRDLRVSVNDQLLAQHRDPGVAHYMRAASKYSSDYVSIEEKSLYHPIRVNDTAGKAQYHIDPDDVPNDANHPDHATDQGHVVLYPGYDHISPACDKYEYDSDSLDQYVYKRSIRNPYYSEDFAKSDKRLKESDCVIYLPLCEAFPELKQTLDKATRGSRLEIDFVKNDVEKAFYVNSKTANAAAGYNLHLDFTSAALWCPQFEAADGITQTIEAAVASGGALIEKYKHTDLYSRTQLPTTMTSNRIKIDVDTKSVQRVLIGFQLDVQQESLFRNPVQFSTLNVSTLQVYINGVAYPTQQYQEQNGPARFLSDVYSSGRINNDYEAGAIINAKNFSEGPMRIYSLDVSNMPDCYDVAKISDIEVRYTLSGAVSGTYSVHTLVESIREMELNMVAGKVKVQMR